MVINDHFLNVAVTLKSDLNLHMYRTVTCTHSCSHSIVTEDFNWEILYTNTVSAVVKVLNLS